MTNAAWLASHPQMTVEEVMEAVKQWYERSPYAVESATPAERLTAWLYAPHEEQTATEAETTVVTTLTVTHILRGIAEENAQELTQWIADGARAALWAGYEGRPQAARAWPDNIGIAGVQVFSFDRDDEQGEAEE